MASVKIQSANTNQTASGGVFTAVALPNVAPGDLLVAIARGTPTSGPLTPTISDNTGNIWILVQSVANGATVNAFYYCPSAVGGTTNITFAQANAQFLEAVFVEYGPSRTLEQQRSTTTAGATHAVSGNITTVTASALIVGWCSNETANGRTATYGGSYSATDSSNGNVFVEDQVLVTPGAIGSDITYSGGNVTLSTGVVAFYTYSAFTNVISATEAIEC